MIGDGPFFAAPAPGTVIPEYDPDDGMFPEEGRIIKPGEAGYIYYMRMVNTGDLIVSDPPRLQRKKPQVINLGEG